MAMVPFLYLNPDDQLAEPGMRVAYEAAFCKFHEQGGHPVVQRPAICVLWALAPCSDQGL